jgi:hypothetical protein
LSDRSVCGSMSIESSTQCAASIAFAQLSSLFMLSSMLLLASLLVLGNFIGPSLSYNATFVIESITTQEWQAFNQSVGGKLRLTQPLAEPCFGGARRGGCSRIQESYNTAGFQTSHFGTYVWVRVLFMMTV